jgi:hypothetical protein
MLALDIRFSPIPGEKRRALEEHFSGLTMSFGGVFRGYWHAEHRSINVAEVVQFAEYFQEVPGGTCDAIARPDQDYVELSAAGIGQELIEAGALRFRPADLVGVLAVATFIPAWTWFSTVTSANWSTTLWSLPARTPAASHGRLTAPVPPSMQRETLC